MKILVLGAGGLLGHVLHRVLSEVAGWDVVGTIREATPRASTAPKTDSLRYEVVSDLTSLGTLRELLQSVAPSVIINAIAPPRSSVRSAGVAALLPALATLPQRIAMYCSAADARAIHVSSDGVFSGQRGGYAETDWPDAVDAYGIAKQLGEVTSPGVTNLRLSMIGPELGASNGLLAWFLAQRDSCSGRTREIFSGLPTVTIAGVIRDYVIPDSTLAGTYHLAAAPISKHDLLVLLASTYGRTTRVVPVDDPVLNRSLDPTKFHRRTGFSAASWPELIASMHADHQQRYAHAAPDPFAGTA